MLRHITQLSAAPVVLDRPGGVVHSERELRIVIPCTGDEKADEAAAVAVEFGVLRGLLDLTSPASSVKAGKPAVAPRSSRSGGGWWRFGIFALAGVFIPFAAIVHAFPGGPAGLLLSQSKYEEFRPGSTGFSLCGVVLERDNVLGIRNLKHTG